MRAIIKLRKPSFDSPLDGKTFVLVASGKVELVPRDLLSYHSEKVSEVLVDNPYEYVLMLEEDILVDYLLMFLRLGAINCKLPELSPYLRSLDFLGIPYSLEVHTEDGGFVCAA